MNFKPFSKGVILFMLGCTIGSWANTELPGHKGDSLPANQGSNPSGLWHWLVDDFEVIMRTHGQITFASYIHGGPPRTGVNPGYRSDFQAYIDFFSWKGLISNWLIANTTLIERSDTSLFKLDRIRYTLTPGYRYEFPGWIISGLLLHECIHTVSRDESNGSIWWNSFQFGFGSKGAYPQFLWMRYTLPQSSRFWNRFDYQMNAGAFLYGRRSIWIAQNHDYRYEQFGMLRYHVGRLGPWGFYTDLNEHLWWNGDGSEESTWSVTANLLLTGRINLAALYYTYTFRDSNVPDNQEGMGALGFKIVF